MTTPAPILAEVRRDPAALMRHVGFAPDLWQEELLRSPRPTLAATSRQVGKSTAGGCLAIATAWTKPGALVLLTSPSLRQSQEIFRRAVWFHKAAGAPVPAVYSSQTRLELANGSRILALPGDPVTTRGFSSVSLLIADEAAYMEDKVFMSLSPVLAVSRGRLVALSTPGGRRGFFHEQWSGGADWLRFKVRAADCDRIDPAFLESERLAMGDAWFSQEYGAEFIDFIGGLYRDEDIQAALANTTQPLELGV
jgi:terminase large subunit-like protein